MQLGDAISKVAARIVLGNGGNGDPGAWPEGMHIRSKMFYI